MISTRSVVALMVALHVLAALLAVARMTIWAALP